MPSPNNLDVVGILQEHGAILNGHFQLPSGFHSQSYVQTSMVMQYPHIAQKIARALSSKFAQEADVVMAPTAQTHVIAQEVARVRKARAIFAEKNGGAMTLRRNFRLREGERVIIVDDVITTGTLTSSAVALVQRYNAHVIGVVAIVDRSTGDLPLRVPVRALISYPLQVFTADNCPLCREHVPLTTPGSPFKPLGDEPQHGQ
ncbi:MAG: orotate phosphoribosyltransferase [Elusimicrobiales bacterium]|nr:orotate phosphoribosyltransferase [Elusimicrobiales bacterium]